ncbi:hypothetical protein ACFLYT_00490 [Nanoarchaeota archaeon]
MTIDNLDTIIEEGFGALNKIKVMLKDSNELENSDESANLDSLKDSNESTYLQTPSNHCLEYIENHVVGPNFADKKYVKAASVLYHRFKDNIDNDTLKEQIYNFLSGCKFYEHFAEEYNKTSKTENFSPENFVREMYVSFAVWNGMNTYMNEVAKAKAEEARKKSSGTNYIIISDDIPLLVIFGKPTEENRVADNKIDPDANVTPETTFKSLGMDEISLLDIADKLPKYNGEHEIREYAILHETCIPTPVAIALQEKQVKHLIKFYSLQLAK